MRTILLALVTLATGCLTYSTESADPTIESVTETEYVALEAMRLSDPPADVCAMLPQDDSPCAAACDPEKLVQFIQPGTCATFVCRLSDETVYRTGGCVPQKPSATPPAIVGAVQPSHAAL